MDIHQIARTYRDTQSQYDKAFLDYFNNQVLPLPQRRFWQIQTVLTNEVHRYRFG